MAKKPDVCTLREVITSAESNVYRERFEEAERLAQSIFNEKSEKYVSLPYW